MWSIGDEKMYELMIIWDSGERETFAYDTLEEAEKHEREFKMVFGGQIRWSAVQRRS